jgi:antitoxin PrlF
MAIKVADDGQVTIPRHILQQLGVGPGSEVDVRHVANGTLVIEKVVLAEAPTVIPDRFDLVRGIAGPGPSTDEIMAELRGD